MLKISVWSIIQSDLCHKTRDLSLDGHIESKDIQVSGFYSRLKSLYVIKSFFTPLTVEVRVKF